MQGAPLTTVLWGASLAAALAALTSCSANRQVEFGPSTSRRPVTVTVTRTVTSTVTASPTTAPSSTTTSPPLTPPGTTLSPASTLPTTAIGTPPFNRELAEQQYSTLVANVTIIDQQLAAGTSPGLSLGVLADDFDTLATLGVPPGLDGPSYLSRLNSLEMFASAAALESKTDLTRARARYDVIRRETGQLLGQVNTALRTTFALTAAPRTPSTATS